MNPGKFSQMMKYLTRAKKADPELPDVFPASKAPIPPVRKDVEQTDAVNQFMLRNPRVEKAGGGMLVQPGFGGVRQGYKEDKYITPARRSGAEGFQGQKFISVKDPTYSDGRRRVKTPEYEKYLKKEIAKAKKRPDYGSKGFIRREPGLLRIAEAMQQADINDDAEFMMPNKKATKTQEKYFNRKMKVFKKGVLEGSDIVYINNLEKNFDDVIFIADQLGESPDWVLDKLEERTEFRDFAKGEKDILKKDPKYTKPRNDYLKVENWVQKNAKKYAKPETFEKALIKRFGKDNQFVKDMNSKKGLVQTYFSDDFKKTMLNITAEKSRSKPSHLKQFIKSSLYNFNPKIKNAVTVEIKNIFKSENLPKLRTEARKLLNNNKLLSTFGLNEAITGPYARVIQAEIGQQLFADITNFRQHRVGTQEMLKAFEQIVADEFKPMFNETAKAIGFSKQNQWPKAKEILGLADNIAWDHKVPSSVIDKGYADIIEYTKVNPTTANFNERIKNAQFDRPINKLITKFEKATTLDAKVKIKNEMDTIKNNFSQKYSGYLDEVSINLDPQGNLKFSSSAKPLSTREDRIAMLGKSMFQAGEITKKQEANFLSKMGFKCKYAKADGGRIGLSTGSGRCDDPASYTDDINKTRQDLKSDDVRVRAAASAKLTRGLDVAKTLPKIGTFLRRAGQATVGAVSSTLKTLGLTTPVGYAIEGMVEGGVYDYFKKQGYTDQQALSETFTPGIITGRPEGVPWYGGAESLLEKELTEGQPKVAQYVDALKDQEQVFDAFGRLDRGQQASRKDITDAAQADIQDLNRSGTISRINRIMNPESMASRAYQTAIERQAGAQDQRARDYMAENYVQTEPSDFSEQQLQKKRNEEMLQMFPTPTVEDVQNVYKQYGVEDRLKSFTAQDYKDEIKNFDDFQKQSYFADNFRLEKAGGGIAGLSGGIDKGPQRRSLNPDSQGLQGLMKRVRNR